MPKKSRFLLEEMDALVKSGKLPDLQLYNKLRQTFGAKAVGRMVNIGPVQTFIDQNRAVYKELNKLREMKEESKAPPSEAPPPRRSNIVRYADVIAGGIEVTL